MYVLTIEEREHRKNGRYLVRKSAKAFDHWYQLNDYTKTLRALVMDTSNRLSQRPRTHDYTGYNTTTGDVVIAGTTSPYL